VTREKPITVGCRVTEETKEELEEKLEELGTTKQEFLENKIKEVINRE